MSYGPALFLLLVTLPLWHSAPIAHAESLLQSTIEWSKDPLTTEKVWQLDPGAMNPHRQLWVIDREVELRGLRTHPNGKFFSGEAEQIQSDSTLYSRAPGAAFACTSLTPEENRKRAEKAAQAWQKQLDLARPTLEKQLKAIRAPNAEAAQVRTYRVFQLWLQAQEKEWRKKIAPLTVVPPNTLPLSKCMEAIPPDPSKLYPILHTRAPARRWGQYYSIRLGLDIGGAKLLGQFLIDPKSETNQISPDWLTAQGVKPKLLTLHDEPDHPVAVFGSDIGGSPIAIRQFQLKNTERFTPPDFKTSCCDGILGRDFLRLYVAELQTTTPPALMLWKRENYRAPSPYIWREISENDVPLMDTRNSTIIDLPHGRFWYPVAVGPVKKTPPPPFSLRYQYGGMGKRELILASILPGTEGARILKAEGIKAGRRVESVNGMDASSLDDWQIRAWLEGSAGPTIVFGFSKKLITIPLSLPESP